MPEKPSVAVKVADQVMLSVVVSAETEPPVAAMSARSKPVTASEKVKETVEELSESLSEASTMLTRREGLVVSMATESLSPVPGLRARSV